MRGRAPFYALPRAAEGRRKRERAGGDEGREEDTGGMGGERVDVLGRRGWKRKRTEGMVRRKQTRLTPRLADAAEGHFVYWGSVSQPRLGRHSQRRARGQQEGERTAKGREDGNRARGRRGDGEGMESGEYVSRRISEMRKV